MADRNDGQDCNVAITDGNGLSLPTIAFAKSVSIGRKANTIDQHGIGEREQLLKSTFIAKTVTLKLMVEGDEVPITLGGSGSVTYTPSASATPVTYVGIWTDNDGDSSADESQMQTLILGVNSSSP